MDWVIETYGRQMNAIIQGIMRAAGYATEAAIWDATVDATIVLSWPTIWTPTRELTWDALQDATSDATESAR